MKKNNLIKSTLSYLKNKNIAVLYGGWSKERDISIKTGKGIVEALKNLNLKVKGYDIKRNFLSIINKEKIDIAFIALHGEGGEDGTIQAVLDVAGIKYTGSEVLASALAMDKFMSKSILKLNKVPTPLFIKYKITPASDKFNIEQIRQLFKENKIEYPCVLKPVNQGSAIGVHIINSETALKCAFKNIVKYGNEILIEEYIQGKEVTVGIVGEEILPVIEIIPKNSFYDFESKYKKGMSDHIIPAKLATKVNAKVIDYAKKAHDVLGCKAVSRVDMIVDNKGNPWVLEVNTIPGMTKTSLLPDAANAVGISYEELVLRIIDYSVKDKN